MKYDSFFKTKRIYFFFVILLTCIPLVYAGHYGGGIYGRGNYSSGADENSVTCGDATCSSSENCTTCASDCGVCAVTAEVPSGGYLSETYYTDNKFSTGGNSFNLKISDKIHFVINNTKNTIVLNKFNSAAAEVKIGEEQPVLLEIGKIYEFDTNQDSLKDLQIVYMGVNKKKASIYLFYLSPSPEKKDLSQIEQEVNEPIEIPFKMNPVYIVAIFLALIIFVVFIFVNKVSFGKKQKEFNRLKRIIGARVYADNGNYVGRVKEIYLNKEAPSIYGWMIKIDRKIRRGINKKKILVKHKYVKSIKKIMLVDAAVFERFNQ